MIAVANMRSEEGKKMKKTKENRNQEGDWCLKIYGGVEIRCVDGFVGLDIDDKYAEYSNSELHATGSHQWLTKLLASILQGHSVAILLRF